MRTRELLIGAACATTLTIAAAGCSSGDDSAGSGIATTAAVPTAAATTATVSSSVAETTTVTTDAVPSSTVLPPALPKGKPLTAGTTYRVARSALGRSMAFTPAVDGSFALNAEGFFGTSVDEVGTEVLVGIADLATARWFPDPSVDIGAVPDPAVVQAATEPAGTDFLAYFGALPYVTVGPIETTEFSGFPARSMTYVTKKVETGFPCFGSDRGPCLLSMYLPVGFVQNYWEGDSGTFYEVFIDGRTFVVEVTDREGATETATGIVIGD